MAESRETPAVALLFADVELGKHLRDALVTLGARIVHEGSAADVRADTLAASGADVVVVNLEPVEEAYLDRVYDALDGGSYQIVFNDAEASRELSGWDKARWARHLAAKLVGSGDVDPPRPASASMAEIAAGPAAESFADELQDDAVEDAGESFTVAMPVTASHADAAHQDTLQSEQLAAELEALIEEVNNNSEAARPAIEPASPSAPSEVVRDTPASPVDVEQRQNVATPPPVTDWGLVDVDAQPPAAPVQADARQFGIDKVDATDYLKPDGGDGSSPLEAGISLELVSLEEAVAPTMSDQPVSEMLLDEAVGGIRRVVVVGAGPDSTSEVGVFLAGLPTTLPALVMLIQHQRDQRADELAAALDTTTRLPVLIARHDSRARQGQVWLVPAGQQCRLDRDGHIQLAAGDTALGDPAIDPHFAALAQTFGADVTAVVLAGPGNDALAGAQEVHDHGGKVWAQDPRTCGDNAMAAAIHDEGLAAFTGSPTELAQRLCEVCA